MPKTTPDERLEMLIKAKSIVHHNETDEIKFIRIQSFALAMVSPNPSTLWILVNQELGLPWDYGLCD